MCPLIYCLSISFSSRMQNIKYEIKYGITIPPPPPEYM